MYSIDTNALYCWGVGGLSLWEWEMTPEEIDEIHMWALEHTNGCCGICWYRTTKPELTTPLNEKECFNLDGTAVEKTQPLTCQSCGKHLALSDVHPKYWRPILKELK